MPCCCSAGEKLLLFITINTAMSRFNWCLKALCCTFILTKQTLLWIALSLWGQRQLSPSPPLGAESSNAPLQSPSLSRQEDLGSLWPFGMEIKDHQKKEMKERHEYPVGWVRKPTWFGPPGCWRTRFRRSISLEGVLGFGEQLPWSKGQGTRGGEWDESSRNCLNGLGLQLELN